MGGVGKTELAIRYARAYKAEYTGGICWLSARESNLALEIVQFAQLHMKLEVPQELGGSPLNYQQQVKWCWQNWQPSSEPEKPKLVLVILDDVTDLRSCRELLPKVDRFRILITTRLLRLDTNFTEISLDVLSPEDALKLLSGVLSNQDRRIQREPQAAQELCKWLGFLPLGLELVSRYLVEDPDLSLEELLQRLKAQKLEEEAINPSEEQLQATEMTAKRGVLAAFELSWKELNPMTQRVGQLLSLFALDMIPWEVVEFVTQHLSWTKAEVDSAKKHFYKRHFIQRLAEKENCYKIHPLIREFLQAKLTELKDLNELKQPFTKAFAAIAQTIPESPTRDLIESVKDVIPHLAEVANNLVATVSNADLVLIFAGLTRFYESQGFYKEAEDWCKQCLVISRKRFGEEHIDIAYTYHNLSSIYYYQGSYTEAEQYLKKALIIRQKLLGDEHIDVAQSLHNLGTLYLHLHQSRYHQAESLLKQALQVRLNLLPTNSHDSIINLNILDDLLFNRRRNDFNFNIQASILEQATKIRRLLLDKNFSIVNYFLDLFTSDSKSQEQLILCIAESLNDLAELNRFYKGFKYAEILLLESLKIKIYFFKEINISIVETLNNLAGIYQIQGYFNEAENLLILALQLRRKLLKEEHPSVIESLTNLADLYQGQTRYRESECLFTEALQLGEKLQNQENLILAHTQHNFAVLYTKQKEYKKAYELMSKALAIFKKVLGDKHPTTLATDSRFKKIYLDFNATQ